MSVRIFGRLPAENFLSVQMPPASAVKVSLKMQFMDLYLKRNERQMAINKTDTKQTSDLNKTQQNNIDKAK